MRQYLVIAMAVVLLLSDAGRLARAASPAAAGTATPWADLVLVDGVVHTGDPHQTTAEAIAVRGERIAYVGTTVGARAMIGPTTRVVDLHGRAVLPGFQDSHVHPAAIPDPERAVDLHGLTRRDEILERIRSFAAAHPTLPWILGDGWDEVAFLPSGQPNRRDLDAVVPDRPAYLTNNSGHEGWANSRALAAAGIGRDTPDPVNGRIEHDADGEPSGALQESAAMERVERVIPAPTAEDYRRTLTTALHTMNAQGITALEDAMATPEMAAAYRALDISGRLPMRVHLCLPHRAEDRDEPQIRRFTAQRRALSGRRMKADCVKVFLDGAYGSHTVALLEPYADGPQYGRGEIFIAQQRLNRLITRLDRLGFRAHFHAQGDAAVRAALDAVAAARKANGDKGAMHTIAHVNLVAASDLPRFRALRVAANMAPLWSRQDPWERVFAPRLFGATRVSGLFPTRQLLKNDALLVWGSDWPVTDVSPIEGLETAVTRRYAGGRDPEGQEDLPLNAAESLTLAEAIAAYTVNGARLQGEAAERGTLTPGKLADFVVLDRDPYAVPALSIHTARVELTVLGGDVVHRAAPAATGP
jgi:predicted amidohydrolase YtcJ